MEVGDELEAKSSCLKAGIGGYDNGTLKMVGRGKDAEGVGVEE